MRKGNRLLLTPRSARSARSRFLWALVMVVVFVVPGACSDPSYVERVTVANPTDYPADVAVAGEEGAGWLSLGIVEANDEKTFARVIDQGDSWVFRFEYFDDHPEEIEFAASELESMDWQVEVPDGFAGALEQEGIEPPP